MTFSSPLRSAGAATLAVAISALSLGALVAPAPAHANGAAFYTAELAAPAAERTNIVGGVAWQCQGTNCAAAKSNSRPLVVCQRVARELGAHPHGGAAQEEEEAEERGQQRGQRGRQQRPAHFCLL